MSSFYVALAIGLILVVFGIWGFARGFRFWRPRAIVLAIVIVLFGYWSDDLETDGSDDEPVPFGPTLPSDAATPDA